MYKLTTKNRVYNLSDIESAGLSYVPFTTMQYGTDTPMAKFKHLWGEREQIYLSDYDNLNLERMRGVQIFTGTPTFRETDGKYHYLVDIDIEYLMLSLHKEHVSRIGKLYRDNIQGNACITRTKSGGLRLSAFTDGCDYKRSFTNDEGMLIEFFGRHAMSKYDDRYEIVEGCILDIPYMPIDVYKDMSEVCHEVGNLHYFKKKHNTITSEKRSIDSMVLEWKEKYLKCGKVQESQLVSTDYCPMTNHSSSRNEIRYTKYPNGSIDGICFNCGERWWEKQKKFRSQPVNKRIDKSINKSINRRLV